MAINLNDLRFFASQRMTDNSDGGGRMSATEIVSGVENSVFDDVSDVDLAVGDISIRKVYALVSSADTDKYLDSGVIVFKQPADPAASVLAMTTGDFYDEREAIKNRLEQTITRGARWNGWLWGSHLVGQRIVVLWQRTSVEVPTVGGRLELVALSGTVEQYSQFLWITKVISNLRTITKDGKTFEVREVLLEIAEALTHNFIGTEPSINDPDSLSTPVYSTRYNPEAVPLYGIMPLSASAVTTDYSVRVDSLYAPIIPTAMSETALPDVNPGGDSPALIAGNTGTIAFTTTTQCIKPNVTLYLGTSAYPGTISISVSGATITDANGAALLAGAKIGTVDYGNGLIRWNSSCSNYSTASKTITFRPATKSLRVADTASQAVILENRGFVWVITLAPIPAPQTLRISYRVNNVWYVLDDLGGGIISGVDSSYGSASLSFTTGTVVLTTGQLPDVDSEIIYSWGTPVNYTARGGDPVDAPVVRGQTANAGVAPGSVSISWTVAATTYTLDDAPANDGNLTGTGGVGFMRYATGEWWVRPTALPPINTDFVVAYDWGDPVEESFSHPLREPNGHLSLVLNNVPRENSIEVEWNLIVIDYEAALSVSAEFLQVDIFSPIPIQNPFDPIKIIRDNGVGLLLITGGTNGSVSYATKTIDFIPDVTVQLPKPLYAQKAIGTWTETIPSVTVGSQTSPGWVITYTQLRTLFDGFEYIPAGAQYPSDETGYVKIRYLVAGGNTSATETVTLSHLNLDVTKGYGETISSGSTRFRIGTDTFVETAGQIYRNPAPDTGAGSLAGTIDRSSGRVYLNQWTGGITNAVTLDSLVTELAGQPVDYVIFRTATSPVKPGTLQLRYTLLDGTAKSKTIDSSGVLDDADGSFTVDYPLGIVRARFGIWKKDSDLSTAEKLEPWYSADARVLRPDPTNPTSMIYYLWKSAMVMADSIIYNAVAQTFLPPDSALLGIDASRLPPDGKGLIFRVGKLALIHNTQSMTENSLSPTQVVDCGRLRLYRVVVKDVNGLALSPEQYTLNRELGTVTMKPALDLAGLTAPFTVEHTVADLLRILETDINGTVTFNKAVSHTYPADTSYLSGVLYIGTLQARVTALFAQSTWTSVWSNALIGTEPLAQFNDAQYPIALTNAGAYPDRILVKFTSATAFQVIGENLGLIGVGDTTHDCSPLNSLTGVAYFTIPYLGWGSGWATGNCLRFNVISAAYPIDLIRAIQPSNPSGLDSDSVELLLLGNVDQ